MTHPKTTVRRKSLWRSKNSKRAAKFARMRAAKERLRIERLAEPTSPDLSHWPPMPKVKPGGFSITIRCLEDGKRVHLRTLRDPWGALTVSPTLAGRKVSAVLANYQPEPAIRHP